MPRNEPDHLVDAATAAAYVTHVRGEHCAPGTIWSWASRGHIHRYGRGRYDIREIDHWIRNQREAVTTMDAIEFNRADKVRIEIHQGGTVRVIEMAAEGQIATQLDVNLGVREVPSDRPYVVREPDGSGRISLIVDGPAPTITERREA